MPNEKQNYELRINCAFCTHIDQCHYATIQSHGIGCGYLGYCTYQVPNIPPEYRTDKEQKSE